MKQFLLLAFFVLNAKYCIKGQIAYPDAFPSNLLGKKLCGVVSTTGKMMGGSTAFLNVPFEVFISKDEGLFVRYNPGDKFGRNEWGQTDPITVFELISKKENKDASGKILSCEYHYKADTEWWGKSHSIKSFSVFQYFGNNNQGGFIKFFCEILIPHYQAATINSSSPDLNICGTLKTNKEKEFEKEIGMQVSLLLTQNKLDEAIDLYKKHKLEDNEIKEKIINCLKKEHLENVKLIDASSNKEDYTSLVEINKENIKTLGPGEYTVNFNQEGVSDLKGFLIKNIPTIKTKGFNVPVPVKFKFSITEERETKIRENPRYRDAYEVRCYEMDVNRNRIIYFNIQDSTCSYKNKSIEGVLRCNCYETDPAVKKKQFAILWNIIMVKKIDGKVLYSDAKTQWKIYDVEK